MKEFRFKWLILSFAICLVFGLSSPASAGDNLLGNGFPSGPHFNLLIHGKSDKFTTCPAPKFEVTNLGTSEGYYVGQIVEGDCPTGATCQQVYGNVINVPRNWGSGDISILMESGRKGPKSNPSATELEVIDWCTKDIDGDDAVLRLPKNDQGYAVYARILGKPGEGGGPKFEFLGRILKLVEDELGNDLLGLGLITPDATYTFEGIELTRFDTSRKGKGVQKATNITSIFEFTGGVCAINDMATFCTGAGVVCYDGPVVCCVPFEKLSNGSLEEAEYCYDETVQPPMPALFAECEKLSVDTNGDTTNDACASTITYTPAGEEDPVYTTNICEVTTQCRDFTNEWIFNIADFVNVLFGIDPDGSYNVQIRFYPLPLLNNQNPTP